MTSLSPPQIEDLRALASEPFRMSSDWESNGHRRQLFFFTNASGDIRLPIPRVTGLAADGFVDMSDDPHDPENMIVQTSKMGRAMLRAADAEMERADG